MDSPGKNTGVGCHFLLQGIFLSQQSNPGLLHCRQIVYHLSHQGSLEKGKAGLRTELYLVLVAAIQPLSYVWLFAPPWTATHQNPLSFTIFQSLLRFMSIEAVMLFNPQNSYGEVPTLTVMAFGGGALGGVVIWMRWGYEGGAFTMRLVPLWEEKPNKLLSVFSSHHVRTQWEENEGVFTRNKPHWHPDLELFSLKDYFCDLSHLVYGILPWQSEWLETDWQRVMGLAFLSEATTERKSWWHESTPATEEALSTACDKCAKLR